jgi:hypothetical protein
MKVLLRFCIHPEVADSKGCKAGNSFVAFFIVAALGGDGRTARQQQKQELSSERKRNREVV